MPFEKMQFQSSRSEARFRSESSNNVFEDDKKLSLEEIEQKKIINDPIRNFLRDQGFRGNPRIKYSIDIITAKNEKGEILPERKTFSNYEDLQNFIENNPEAIVKKKFIEETGVMPYKVDYDQSVYDWMSELGSKQTQKIMKRFDKLIDGLMDVKNFKKMKKVEIDNGIEREINRAINQILSHLDNSELPQIVGDRNEIIEIVKRMLGDARRFKNSKEKIKAAMAEKDLQQLGKYLKSGTVEDLLNVDRLFGNYVYRVLFNKIQGFLNRTDIPLPWREKDKMLKILLLVGKIRDREDAMKTRDLLAQERNFQRIVKKYELDKLVKNQEEKGRESLDVKDSKSLKEELKLKEQLPKDSRALNRYFVNNFRKFEDMTLGQFKRDFNQGMEQKYQAWMKQYINTIIKEQRIGVKYPDNVASVLGNAPVIFQSIASLKEGRNISYDELLRMPFSKVVKKYLNIDVPKDYFDHFH